MRKIAVYEKVFDMSTKCPCYIFSFQRKQSQNKKREKLWVNGTQLQRFHAIIPSNRAE